MSGLTRAPTTRASAGASGARIATPSPKYRKERARIEARENAIRNGKTPAEADKAGAEAEAIAKQRINKTQQENKNDLLGGNKPDPKSKKNKDGTLGKQDEADSADLATNNKTQEKSLKDMILTPKGIAILAALGLTLALTLTFIIKAALAAKACTDCRDYKINITDIKPSPSTIPLIGGLFNPTMVDVSYTAPTEYEPLEGKESFTFKDTGFPELDGQTMTVEKVLGKNKVRVKCGSDDCSAISGKTGTINPNCADFNDRFNREIEKAAEGAGNAAGSLFKGLFKNLGTALFVIAICFGLYFAVSAMSKS